MAEAIVSFAIERISDLLNHEAVFLLGVRKEVEGLKADLVLMKRSLEDADRRQDQSKLNRALVGRVRDLAYDAEDVIDDFILQVADQGGFHGIIKRFTKLFHLHKIGKKVKAIQTELESISKKLPVLKQIAEGEGSRSISEMQQLLRRTYTHVEEEDVVSLEDTTKEVLAQLMTEEDRLHVVSIVGMGGIGKTTLARKVYNRIDVKRHFDCCAWVSISQQCNPGKVLHFLLIKLLSPTQGRKQIDKLQEHELVTTLHDGLKDKRYLIVLDDIWRSDHWDYFSLAFPKKSKGSKILFTTRIKNVAGHADRCNSQIELSFLTDDESWQLFKRKAFPGNRTESHACPEELEMPGREMVKKCGGLPLAIAVLGGLLATKETRDEWESVQRNINAHSNNFPLQDDYDEVNWILGLSYTELPFHLKPCFLYLAHYPEDWEISKKELIRLWIAEGFISPLWESRGMLMEEVAERFLEELIDRCLVQVGQRDYTGTGVKTCRIHDLLRDLCLQKAKEENFLKLFQPSLMENGHVNLTPDMARIIAIHPSGRDVVLNGSHPNLRSLLFFQEKSIDLNILKCNGFKFLRVLKLEGSRTWHVSSEIGNLLHLRYLKWREPLFIYSPLSIGKLKNLHTLDIPYLKSSIPDRLFKWRCLRHIRVHDLSIKHVDLLGRDILKNVETLKSIWSESLIQKNAVLDLANIRSLGIKFKRSKEVKLIVKALIESQRLQSLYMGFEDSVSSPDLEPLSHCHHLSKLSAIGDIQVDRHSSHHVLNFLPASIVKLTLVSNNMRRDPMAVLGKLRHLRTLLLRHHAYWGTKMVCSANDFLQLDFLEIGNLSALEEWQIEEGAMPRLRSLTLYDVPNLRIFPEGLGYITSLQEIKLRRMKRSLVEGEEFSKVRHVPSILIDRLREG